MDADAVHSSTQTPIQFVLSLSFHLYAAKMSC